MNIPCEFTVCEVFAGIQVIKRMIPVPDVPSIYTLRCMARQI